MVNKIIGTIVIKFIFIPKIEKYQFGIKFTNNRCQTGICQYPSIENKPFGII